MGIHSRREYIKKAGAASLTVASVGFAGCAGDDANGDYPDENQTIEFIVPFGEGGGTDAYARQLAPALSEALGGTEIQIENVPGAASLRGTGELFQAEPDGYTICAFNPPSTPIASLVHETDYDITDLEGVASYGFTPHIIIADANSGVESMDDLVEQYQEGQFETIGGCQEPGGMNHISTIIMANEYDMPSEYIGYDGCGSAGQALASGDIPATIGADDAYTGLIEDGRANEIVSLTSEGSSIFPDLESLSEQGDYEDLDYVGQLNRSLYFPPGTPGEIIETMTAAIDDAIQSDDVQQWAEDSENIVWYEGPEVADEQVRETVETIPEQVDLEEIREAAGG